MAPRPEDVEEYPEPNGHDGWVLSMRTKLSLGGLCFFALVMVAAYSTTPYVAEAIRGLGQGGQPAEEGLDINTTLFFEDFDSQPEVTGMGGFTGFSWQNGYLFVNTTVNERYSEESEMKYRGGHVWFINSSEGQPWPTILVGVGSPGEVGGGGLQMRMRFSDDNGLESEKGGGTRSWGLSEHPDWGCVREASFYSSSPGNLNPGLWAQSGIWDGYNVSVVRKAIQGIDITEWHDYAILCEPENTTFLVDGVQVATIPESTDPLKMLAFVRINNCLYAPGGTTETPALHGRYYDTFHDIIGFADLEEESWMQIDYVHMFWTSSQVEQLHNLNEVPEPALLPILSVLGLILLPTLLRRR